MTNIPIKKWFDAKQFPFACPYCKSRFSRSIGWIKQLRNQSFACEACNASLRLDSQMALAELDSYMESAIHALKNKISIPPMRLTQVVRVKLAEEKSTAKPYVFDYSVYDRVLQLTHERMIKDARDQRESLKSLVNKASNAMLNPFQAETFTGKSLRIMALPITAPAALSVRISTNLSTYNEGDDTEFDLKPLIRPLAIVHIMPFALRSLRSGSPVPLVPIRGDLEYLYYYDVWGNIYFGYITAAANHWYSELWVGNAGNNLQNYIRGSAAEDDQLSVGLGYELYYRYGLSLTKEQLESEIFAFRLNWSTDAIRFTPRELGLQ